MEMNKFRSCREVLCNDYQSRNLISPYHFWGISPWILTSSTRPFLARRHTQPGHETTELYASLGSKAAKFSSHAAEEQG